MNKLNLSPEQLATLTWRKPRHSNPSDSNVEVAFIPHGGVVVRNSGEPDDPWLFYTEAEWVAFVGGAKDGEFDL